MTSIADQTEHQLGGALSILVRQKRDHVRLEQLLHELEVAAPHDEPRALRRIYRLVFPHAFAEEAVLWPAARRVLADGDALTLEVEVEHQHVNELVARLDDPALADADRASVRSELVAWLRQDVRDEEDELLPSLQAALGPGRLRLLGLAWETVRRTAPTRAHPGVSRRPPGQSLSALPLTLLDRSRDLLDEAAERTSRGRAALAGASRTLGHASTRVERWQPFRVGERAQTHRG